jgi:hypothetical protein
MNIPILSYLKRYWWVLLLVIVTFTIGRNDGVWAVLDAFAVFPVLFCVSWAFALLWRNLFNRNTTDAFVDSGRFKTAFNALSEEKKVELTMMQMNGYVLAGSIIALGIVLLISSAGTL